MHEVAGTRVVQINTGSGCHLDAETLSRSLTRGEGMERWYAFQRRHAARKAKARA